MATYREIKGTEIGYESAAPGASIDAGKIWYNTTDSKLQTYLSSGSWGTTSPMINVGTAKNYGANGTQNAFWITNGGAPGVLTEEYNGTGWTSSGDIGTSRPTQNGGFGTLTAGANFGGNPALTTGDTYNGPKEHNISFNVNTKKFKNTIYSWQGLTQAISSSDDFKNFLNTVDISFLTN